MKNELTDITYLLLNLLVMAGVTYLVRMLPMTLFTGRITNRFLRSFLYYIPGAVISAMTFPAIFFSTGNLASGIIGTAVGLVMAFCGSKLLAVTLGACGSALAVELIIMLL